MEIITRVRGPCQLLILPQLREKTTQPVDDAVDAQAAHEAVALVHQAAVEWGGAAATPGQEGGSSHPHPACNNRSDDRGTNQMTKERHKIRC
jgi:hypothetical protein